MVAERVLPIGVSVSAGTLGIVMGNFIFEQFLMKFAVYIDKEIINTTVDYEVEFAGFKAGYERNGCVVNPTPGILGLCTDACSHFP